MSSRSASAGSVGRRSASWRVAAVIGEEWDLAVAEAALCWPEERSLDALEAVLVAQLVLPAPGGPAAPPGGAAG